MDTIKYIKERIYRELTKVRSALSQVLNTEEQEPEVIPNIVVGWGEIAELSDGLQFDGTLAWQSLLDHIINLGLASVLSFTRTCKLEDQLERLRHKLRVLNTIVRQYLEQTTPTFEQFKHNKDVKAKCSWNVV